MKNSFFVPGLWFKPTGEIGRKIKTSFTILDQCGTPSLKARVKDLEDKLPSHVQTLVAHSAGCTVVAELIKKKGFIAEQVILLNPAPPKGVKFGLRDPLFWRMMRPEYVIPMVMGHQFMLNRKDVTTLLSVPEGEIDKVMANLQMDSGKFANELTFNQYARTQRFDHYDGRLAIVSSKQDLMMGKTWKKTERHFKRNNYDAVIQHYERGHLWTLQNLCTVLSRLQDRGFEFEDS